MEKQKTNSEQFCHDLLSLGIKYCKAFTNLVMSLASYERPSSTTSLSESILFHHEYSSIRDAIYGVGQTDEERSENMSALRHLCLPYLEASVSCDWLLLQTDATGIAKPYSACLEDRQYIKISNNPIRTNKPITKGIPVSLVNVSVLDKDSSAKWSIPLDIRRISSAQSANEVAVTQVKDLLTDETLGFGHRPIINTLDSGYGCPAYLADVYEHENLVNICRFRFGRKVYTPFKAEVETSPQTVKKRTGRPPIYEACYYLTDSSKDKLFKRKGESHWVHQQSIFDLPEDDYLELEGTTAKGRALKILIWRWNDLLIPMQKGKRMDDKPFDLIASRVIDVETGEMVFKRTMFTTINGKRKAEISTQQAFEAYRHRYDIEPSIKFVKQHLLFDKFQAGSTERLENWFMVVMAAYWLLFAASKEVTYQPKKWQQYKPVNKKVVEHSTSSKIVRLTPNQTKQAAERLFSTFDPSPFRPQNTKKGKGRAKGTKLEPRTRYKVVKKRKKKRTNKLTIEKLE